jgi:hypothetical protein
VKGTRSSRAAVENIKCVEEAVEVRERERERERVQSSTFEELAGERPGPEMTHPIKF